MLLQRDRVIYKTSEEIEIMRANGDLLGRAHAEVAKLIAPGVTTARLDEVATQFIMDNGGHPSFKGYNKFPAALCISVNEVVVHGFPSQYQLQDGDIISVDCGVYKNGYHADSAFTYPVGSIKPEVKALLATTHASLYKAIEVCVAGNRLGDIGYAVQSHCEAAGYSVVRELVGHGLGKKLHEAPEVANYGKQGRGPLLKDGMVIAIEPMINMGTRKVVQERDGWTIRTADRLPSAHYEHTVAINNGKADVLTTFKYIEQVLTEKYGETGIY